MPCCCRGLQSCLPWLQRMAPQTRAPGSTGRCLRGGVTTTNQPAGRNSSLLPYPPGISLYLLNQSVALSFACSFIHPTTHPPARPPRPTHSLTCSLTHTLSRLSRCCCVCLFVGFVIVHLQLLSVVMMSSEIQAISKHLTYTGFVHYLVRRI